VLAEFKGEHARLLRTSLSPDQEARLRQVLVDETSPTAEASATV